MYLNKTPAFWQPEKRDYKESETARLEGSHYCSQQQPVIALAILDRYYQIHIL